LVQVFTIEAYAIESGAVAQFLHARLLGAVIAAEHPAALLHPWPMMRTPQCSQVGASVWIAHSKLSNVWVLPCATT
jgi:hypothetical protein